MFTYECEHEIPLPIAFSQPATLRKPALLVCTFHDIVWFQKTINGIVCS